MARNTDGDRRAKETIFTGTGKQSNFAAGEEMGSEAA